MKSASLVYGKLDPAHPVRVRIRGRRVPIVIVPDFMGTRLTEADSKDLVWNPTGFPMSALDGPNVTPGPFVADMERLAQVSATLVPDEDHPSEREAERNAVKDIKHYDHLITPWYGPMAKALAANTWVTSADKTGKLGIRPRVYCCGYDWRQDNAKSALTLARAIDDALAETGEEKCILVAHGMGGLIARHYCKALGGESKVFAMFAIGVPLLGAPTAYTQLKHGIPAPYVKEFFKKDEDDDDPDATNVDNAITEIASAFTSIATMVAAPPGEGALGYFSPLYIALSLGAGKLLSRRETIEFGRQLPSAYQMMPSSIFCNKHRQWLFFDPLNTGQPASGYLIKFPTLMDATVVTLIGNPHPFHGAAASHQPSLAEAANTFLHGSEDDRSNLKLAGANSEDLAEFVAGVGKFFIDMANPAVTIGDPEKSRMQARATTLIDRATKSFLDCRSSHALYSDIFTGLLDIPSLRALSAYHLESSYHFDDSITENAKDEDVYSIESLLETMLGAVWNGLKSLVHPETDASLAERHRREAEEQAEEDRKKPKAYVHPKTIVYATNNIPTDGGSVLLCYDIHSNYDSNVVKWQIVQNLFGLAMSPPSAGGDTSAIFFGDGVVPYCSARPPNDILTDELDTKSHDFQRVSHTKLCANDDVICRLKADIVDLLPDWYEEGA